MERTPSKSGEDDSSSKKRPAIEQYFSKVVRPVESLRLIPDPETKPEVRRVVPLIPEAVVLFDRHENLQVKDGKESEKPAETDAEEETANSSEEDDEEETTTGEKQFKKPFRPVIPRAPVATLLRPLESKPAEVIENQKGLAAEFPDVTEVVSASGASEQPAPATTAFESQSGSLIDAFGELPTIEDYAEDGDDYAPVPPASTPQIPLPRYTAPSPNTQAATANQWPHYNYYSPNTPLPPPGGAAGGGGQPPVPPRPSAGMGMGGVPSLNPNVYPLAAAGGVGPNYNTAPAPANLPIAPTGERRIGTDPLARLMGVGNWIGNRRTRKKLGNRIDQLQSDTGKNMAELQSRQNQFEQKQSGQSQEVQRMQMQAERSAAVTGVSLVAESAPHIPTQRVESPRLATQNKPPVAEMSPPQQGQEAAGQRLTPETKQQSTTWLNLELDKRGNVVSNTQEFGQGFHRERQQEIQRDRLGDSTAAGAVSLMGVQQDQHAPIRYDSSLPSGLTTPSLPGGMPARIDPQHRMASENKKTSGVPGPVFWIMLAIIVAAFFAAAFI